MICAVELDGFGVVGSEITVDQIDADGTSGTALLYGDVDLSAWVGAHVWVASGSDLPSGYYTVLDTSGVYFEVAYSGGAISWSGSVFAYVEDHARLCDGIPAFVTGASALANWAPVLFDAVDNGRLTAPAVTPTAGMRIPPLGGISSVDGLDIRLSKASVPWQFAALRVTPTAGQLIATIDEVDTTTKTTGEIVVDEVTWIGDEAIHALYAGTDAVEDGVTRWSTLDVRRGILRSPVRVWEAGTWAGNSRPPEGIVARVWRYDSDAASHADRTLLYTGRVEAVRVERLGTSVVLSLASHLLAVAGRALTGRQQSVLWRYSEAYSVGGLDTPPVAGWTMEPLPRVGRDWSRILSRGFAGPVPSDLTDGGLCDTFASVVRLKFGDSAEVLEDAAATMSVADDLTVRFWPVVDDTSEEIEIAREVRADGFYSDVRYATGTNVPVEVLLPVNVPRPRNDDERGSSVNVFGYASVHPVEAIRQILQSTGTGGNGDFDTLPVECGYGLPDEWLDTASFDDAIASARHLTAGNVAIRGDELDKVADILASLLKTYCYALASDGEARVRIVDLAVWSRTGAPALAVSDLALDPANPTSPVVVDYDISTADTVTTASIAFEQPWSSTRVSQNRVAGAAWPVYLSGLGSAGLEVSPPFAAYVDATSEAEANERWRRFLTIQAALQSRLVANVLPTWDGDVGDVVRVTIDRLPGVTSEAASLDAYGRVMDRERVVRPVGYAYDKITVQIWGNAEAPPDLGLWAASALISVVNADDDVDVNASAYGDPARFRVGDRVWLWSARWTALCDTYAEIATVTSTNITLVSPWQLGGLDVTPGIGDKITLYTSTGQPSATAAEWAWIQSETPAQEWI